jgi:quinol monooxygenase YgiN/DNA-binding XRE family transcriptional regulator
MRPVGELLQEAREEAGLSLDEAASRVGIASTALEAMETGADEKPDVTIIEPLAYLYGKPLGEMMQAGGWISQAATNKPGVISINRCKPGQREAALAVIAEYLREQVMGEDETLTMIVLRDVNDPDVILLHELWSSTAGVETHMNSAAHIRLKDKLWPLIESSTPFFAELAFGKNLTDADVKATA